MSSDEVKNDRRYTKDHEWAKAENGAVRVGITAFAVDQLGDITLINIDVKVGDTLEEGKAFGTIESVKTLSDLFAPINGTVSAINAELETRPELVNEDCYGKAWMGTTESTNAAELGALLEPAAYKAHVDAQ